MPSGWDDRGRRVPQVALNLCLWNDRSPGESMDLVYKDLSHGCMIVVEKGAEVKSKYKADFKTLTTSSSDPYPDFLQVFLRQMPVYSIYRWWELSQSHVENSIATLWTQWTLRFIKQRNFRCLVAYPLWREYLLFLDHLCNLKLWYMHMRFSVWKDRLDFLDRLERHSGVLWWMITYYLGFLTQDALYTLRNKIKALQGCDSLPHVACRCAWVLKMIQNDDWWYKNLARLNKWGKRMGWIKQKHNMPVIYCVILVKLLVELESDIRISWLSALAFLPVSQMHNMIIWQKSPRQTSEKDIMEWIQ